RITNCLGRAMAGSSSAMALSIFFWLTSLFKAATILAPFSESGTSTTQGIGGNRGESGTVVDFVTLREAIDTAMEKTGAMEKT
ncbi:MAG: hypothetical protein MUO31_12040, partial [Thermodesulfovibrionales bacterium]|nr:hypothetical protein [Thermodesulfovibrionales bacterium]